MAELAASIRPWEVAAYERLAASVVSDRVPHAVLLEGAERAGLARFAAAAAALLTCSCPGQGGPCGECRSCQLTTSGNHPDYLRVEPEESERPVIKVDQIRDLIGQLSLSSHAGGRRVAVIDPADTLNIQAANSLLKTLEEPPSGVTLILTTTTPGRLPPTIRSRCQAFQLPLPSMEQASSWLEHQGRSNAVALLDLAAESPERAMALADAGTAELAESLVRDLTGLVRGTESASAVAAKWQGVGVATVVFLSEQLLLDALRHKAAGGAANRVPHAEELNRLVAPLDWRVLYECKDELASLRRALEQPLNEIMALERLFLGWALELSQPTRDSD